MGVSIETISKDAAGAKAPGKPGALEGFVDPKGGEECVCEPNGGWHGWRHKDGSVWAPTGWRGIAHAGPHWDVQYPNGGHRNALPAPRWR